MDGPDLVRLIMTLCYIQREMWLAQIPPATRPSGIKIREDHRLYEIAEGAGFAMAKRLAVLALSPRTPEDARTTLLAWFADFVNIINDSDQREAMTEAVEVGGDGDELSYEDILTWLRAEWSTREALDELLWRCCLHPTLISAALILYDAAGLRAKGATCNQGTTP